MSGSPIPKVDEIHALPSHLGLFSVDFRKEVWRNLFNPFRLLDPHRFLPFLVNFFHLNFFHLEIQDQVRARSTVLTSFLLIRS